MGHILRDCTAVVAKKGVSGVDGTEVAPSASARGTLASFVVKRRPVVCSGDCEWRSVNASSSATVDRGVELCDGAFEGSHLFKENAPRSDGKMSFPMRVTRCNSLAPSDSCKERTCLES